MKVNRTIINLAYKRIKEIRMMINTSDHVLLVYSFMPKIKYRLACEQMNQLGFKLIETNKIGVENHEHWKRQV